MLLPPGGLAHGAGTLLCLHSNVRDFEQTAIEVMTHRNQQTPLDNGTSAVKVCASTLPPLPRSISLGGMSWILLARSCIVRGHIDMQHAPCW